MRRSTNFPMERQNNQNLQTLTTPTSHRWCDNVGNATKIATTMDHGFLDRAVLGLQTDWNRLHLRQNACERSLQPGRSSCQRVRAFPWTRRRNTQLVQRRARFPCSLFPQGPLTAERKQKQRTQAFRATPSMHLAPCGSPWREAPAGPAGRASPPPGAGAP